MRKIVLIALFIFLLVVFSNEIFAGTIKLRWDPVGDNDLDGYKVYFGYESGVYTEVVDVGNTTTHTLSDLQDCTTHFIAVTSYDYHDNESDLSNEVSGWARPIIETMSPSSAKQGERVSVVFSGSNYDDGSYPYFSSPDITVEGYYQNSCNELVADILLKGGSGDRPAKTGFYTVSIINSDDIQGDAPLDFEIKTNENFIDTDGSGKVDGLDLAFLALHFGTQEGDEYYEPSVDFNGDGWIDGDDIAILSSYFGEYLN